MKRNQWAAGFVALLLFLCGAAVGALAHRYYAITVVNAKTTAEDFRQAYIREMRTKVHLTDDQVSKLNSILDDTKSKYKAVRDSYRPEMLKIKNEQISQVTSILTRQQVPLYEQLVAEHEQRAEQDNKDHLADQRAPENHQQNR